MKEFKHYGKEVWRQVLSETNWVEELKKSGLEYVALPDIEHEIYKYVKDGKERYALIHYPDVPEEYWQEVYIIEKIPDDLNWDNIVKDYRWEKEENPERFTDWRNLQAGHIDPKQFRLALMSLGTSLEELKEMDHEDTPEIDEL